MSTTTGKEQSGRLSLDRPGRLNLTKTVASGQVRQSFSHGRSKAVTVEVKRKRTFERGAGGTMKEVKDQPLDEATRAAAEIFEDGPKLTEQERAARLRALRGAAADAQRRQQEEAEAELRAAEEAKQRAEEEARRQEAEAKRQAEEGTPVEPQVTPAAIAEAEAAAARGKPAEPKAKTEERAPLPEEGDDRVARPEQKRPATLRARGEPRRRAGKLTIVQALETETGELERARSAASIRRAREREKKRRRGGEAPTEHAKFVREVVVPESITVAELGNRMAVRGIDVVKTLMRLGIMTTLNQTVDQDTADLVISEFGHRIKRVAESDVELGLEGAPDDEASLVARAPVVTVMGHVDHGKTSLLDALRKTDVVAGEAGGITQHIGAYQVTLEGGAEITFLDTPGHQAFTAMRARGAKVTDIVVLVVAADDGVQPQTVEALHHAKAAGVPMIIAINKIDRPDADPNRVRTALLSHEIVVESMGGDVLDVEVSATQGTNLDKLEEAVLLQAELLELRANPDRAAQGTVVEAQLERGRGAVATVLVQRGTLRVGDVIIAGAEWGRVRALIDDKGRNLTEAGPSMPVAVLGLQNAPSAGDDFAVVEDEAQARAIADYRQRKGRDKQLAAESRGTLEQMFSKIKDGQASELPVLVKADVQGSAEAIAGALEGLGTNEVKCNMLHAGVGGITESDVGLAKASGGVILGFNVRANPQAREAARREHVDIRYYSIIYDLVDDIKKMMGGLLAPEQRETTLGYAQIREVFSVTRAGKVAGCFVTEGTMRRGAKIRILRDDVVIYQGALKTLRRFKDDVREVQNNYECGMAFENFDDIKQGDVIECFEVEEVERVL